MNVAYCCLLLPEEKKLAERTKKKLPGVSLHKLSTAIISGLEENLQAPLKIFNIINTLNYPDFPALMFKTEKWSHRPGAEDWHVGYINLFGIKYITQRANLFRRLDRWVKRQGAERCMVCVHHIYYPILSAAVKLKKKYGGRVTICLITGDLTGQYGIVSSAKQTLKQRLTASLEAGIDRMIREFDCFVFATEPMAAACGVAEKPFTVMECAYIEPKDAPKSPAPEDTEAGERIIFYAGSIREEYGILHLLRAFSMIPDKNYRLVLAGDGEAAEAARACAREDPRIEVLGFIPPGKVAEWQQTATVLINPRTSQYEFVKYSFPSKTMESLASGKPYIAHRLPCDPPEYAAYIQYADGETDEALRDKIVEICELPAAERAAMGWRAQRFIEEEKNPAAMCRRIVDMWEQTMQA